MTVSSKPISRARPARNSQSDWLSWATHGWTSPESSIVPISRPAWLATAWTMSESFWPRYVWVRRPALEAMCRVVAADQDPAAARVVLGAERGHLAGDQQLGLLAAQGGALDLDLGADRDPGLVQDVVVAGR